MENHFFVKSRPKRNMKTSSEKPTKISARFNRLTTNNKGGLNKKEICDIFSMMNPIYSPNDSESRKTRVRSYFYERRC